MYKEEDLKHFSCLHQKDPTFMFVRFPDTKVPRLISDTELDIEGSLKARMIQIALLTARTYNIFYQDLIIQVGLRLPGKLRSFCIFKNGASLSCQDVSCLFAFPFKSE